MSIPLDEANRIKNELDQVFDGQNVTISIVQPLGETAVVIEAPQLNGNQIQAIIHANSNHRFWSVDDKSEKGIRVSIWTGPRL
ncbi:MAG: hypothetical protein ETSY1_32445 [Candidatus Entotheonella factor]|uniref:Uncharacterized protein n=1 Tax=Entotheonella factor TaxID=1429438 RepID=W4LA72_ENTF1|nr:hypothetical protein [Candidatus Entotheonella palauensis]ETW94998.1 MAG: hypothetical protein ETSY1_32445 [Candidatus Entotheonella factor]